MNDRISRDRDYTPPPLDDEPPERGKLKSKPRFPLIVFDDVLMSTTSFHLVKDLIPREGLVVIWGPPKCGKSFWTLDVFMHIACGWEYRGLRVKSGAIVYCVLEGQKGFTRRIAAFRKKYPASKGAPFYLMFTPLNLIVDVKALIASIRAQLPKDVDPGAVVIDTLNRILVGSENKDEDMAAYVRAADAVHAAFHCVVAVVHHCGHDERRLRGHSSLIGAADTEISIKRDAANNLVTTLERSKDGETGLEIISRLVRVNLGNDDDGDPITSCVLEPVGDVGKADPAKPTAAKRARPLSQIDLLKAAFLETYDRLAPFIPHSGGHGGFKGFQKVPVDAIRDELREAGYLEINDDTLAITNAARLRLGNAKKQLLAEKTLKEANRLIWRAK
jgi:AAA domain